MGATADFPAQIVRQRTNVGAARGRHSNPRAGVRVIEELDLVDPHGHGGGLNGHAGTSESIGALPRDLLRRERRGELPLGPDEAGERGFEGKVQAARYCRLNNVPYLGLCFGLHVMTVEFARAYFDTEDAHSIELDPETAYPVITLLDEQRRVVDKGGTMRLGNFPCKLVPGTATYEAYGEDEVQERHRHRFEFNNEYREVFDKAGRQNDKIAPAGARY